MRWVNFPLGMFHEFSLSWELVGVSMEDVSAYVRANGPKEFHLSHRLGPEVKGGQSYAQWEHEVDSGQMGNYASIWIRYVDKNSWWKRYSDKNRSLRVVFTATRDNIAYPAGLRFLAGFLRLSHSALKDISFWLNCHEYGYYLTLPGLSREQLDMLCTDVTVEPDKIVSPGDPTMLSGRLEIRGEKMFLVRQPKT